MSDEKPVLKETRIKIARYEKIVEISTWVIVIAIIFGVRLLPQDPMSDANTYYLVGAIVSFALIYYLVIYKYFPRPKRLYIKDIADIILIGVLILLMKDWGQYFFVLFFLPIAAAALSLEFINALLIATIASVFVVFEIFLGSQDLLTTANQTYEGMWQIGLIILMTVFCRILAIQIRQEKSAKEESLAYQKVLKEEAKRQKELLSLTSHQLNTPLSIIRGFSSMLNDGSLGKLSPEQKDAVQEIHTNTKRMAHLGSEILSISYIQSGKVDLNLKDYQLEELLQHCINQVKIVMAKKDVIIKYDKPQKLPTVSIDVDKMSQVIYNLIDNALKYTLKGTIKITCQKVDKDIKVLVKDEGIGIKKEDFDNLFQPFFRGKNILELDNKGTGLGLYIGRLIIEKHKGKIWAESLDSGQGSTFGFTIPIKE